MIEVVVYLVGTTTPFARHTIESIAEFEVDEGVYQVMGEGVTHLYPINSHWIRAEEVNND